MLNFLDPLVELEAKISKALPLPPGPATLLSQMQVPGLPGMPGRAQAEPNPQINPQACPYGGA